MAILSQARPGRDACCSCGFCMQGCRTGAMYSTAAAEIPPALETGRLDLRPNAVALRVLTSANGAAAETVEYVDTRDGAWQRQSAGIIILANNTIELPRLLLNSACTQHPAGLANGSGQVGRNFMAHPSAHCVGIFEEEMNPHEGFVLNHLCCLDFARTQPGLPFIRGFVMETSTSLPAGLASGLPGDYWGRRLKRLMRRYRRTAGLFTICEGLPSADNRVTGDPGRRDQWGLPQAHLHYDWHDNDVRLMGWAADKSAEVLRAAGTTEVIRQPQVQVHMMGTARMGRDPGSSVADSAGRTHEVDNLYLAGGALFPTGAAVNPTLTILALAWRTAEAVARRVGATIGSVSIAGERGS
jgi:choline dehydrogenase-like flavoprotein